jgi:hypothetical protein
MAIYVVALHHVHVKLLDDNGATITIRLPEDYETNHIADAKDRRKLESLHRESPAWIRQRIKDIIRKGEGVLADDEYPMRSPGAGVLPLLPRVPWPIAEGRSPHPSLESWGGLAPWRTHRSCDGLEGIRRRHGFGPGA